MVLSSIWRGSKIRAMWPFLRSIIDSCGTFGSSPRIALRNIFRVSEVLAADQVGFLQIARWERWEQVEKSTREKRPSLLRPCYSVFSFHPRRMVQKILFAWSLTTSDFHTPASYSPCKASALTHMSNDDDDEKIIALKRQKSKVSDILLHKLTQIVSIADCCHITDRT